MAKDTIQLDSLVIIPEKIRLSQSKKTINPRLYQIDFETSQLILDPSLIGDSIQIEYYTFPDLPLVSFSKDTAFIVQPQESQTLFSLTQPTKKRVDLFSGLNSRGSLIRGITFGNNQGAAVQSSLDLQLNGRLSDDVFINAAISDNNAPIETGGFTQQLQEFDQVYVEIYNKDSKIRAGHLNLIQTNDFFANFTEKVTGLQVGTQIIGEKYTTNVSVAGSVSRGEFVSTRFNGQDGNQGPYRLPGNSNELFIIIISGSERVYMDGILLQRGEDQDYTINYNTGEITFTSNRLITANNRLLVEYLYADRNYSRFLFYSGIETKSDRFRIAGHFYSNGDSKGNPINQNITDENEQILAEAGDNQSAMVTISAQQADFDVDRIQYRQITVNGVEVFEFTTDETETVFNANFSFVGQNNGNYIQTDFDTNGRVFSYVEPIGGVPQGEYEPIQQLIAPERLQLYTMNSAYQFKNNGEIGVDLALSNRDLNLFSNLDNDDNAGFAGRVFTHKNFKTKQWEFTPSLEYSFIQDRFNSIQRIRYEEFAREFNVNSEFDSVNQNYAQVKFQTQYKDIFKLDYGLSYLDNQGIYTGIRNRVLGTYQTPKNWIQTKASLLNSDELEDQSTFNQLSVRARRKLGKTFWAGAEYGTEDNQIQRNSDNSLTERSFRWNEYRFLAGVGDSTKIYSQIALYTRRDDSARLGNLTNLSQANGAIFKSRLLNKATNRLDLNAHFRSVNYNQNEFEDEDFLTGNVRWSKSFYQNGITLNAFYELESGREPQREFQYVEVSDGLGIYKYTDYNGDGIQQLDEFEIAEFQDEANYIRVFTNTINLVRTNKNQFNISLGIFPKRFVKNRSFLNRWQMQFSLQASNSVQKEERTLVWNPFDNPESSLAKNRNYRLNFQYNPSNKRKWGASYNFQNQENQFFLFTGSETRSLQNHQLQAKYKILKDFLVFMNTEYFVSESDSDIFAARRFQIQSYALRPEITYKIGKSFNASLEYEFQKKVNDLGIESLNQSQLKTEFQWNSQSKNSWFSSFSYVNNRFTGNENSVVGNQMMEGLRAGNNFVWQLLFQRELTSYLNINLTYNGRKTEANPTVHSGSVQVQLRF